MSMQLACITFSVDASYGQPFLLKDKGKSFWEAFVTIIFNHSVSSGHIATRTCILSIAKWLSWRLLETTSRGKNLYFLVSMLSAKYESTEILQMLREMALHLLISWVLVTFTARDLWIRLQHERQIRKALVYIIFQLWAKWFCIGHPPSYSVNHRYSMGIIILASIPPKLCQCNSPGISFSCNLSPFKNSASAFVDMCQIIQLVLYMITTAHISFLKQSKSKVCLYIVQ